MIFLPPAIPNERPRIEGVVDGHFRVDDLVNLNCTAAPSMPAATLLWYINDDAVSIMGQCTIVYENVIQISLLSYTQNLICCSLVFTIFAILYQRGLHSSCLAIAHSNCKFSGMAWHVILIL